MNELIAWVIAGAVIIILINTNVADGLFDALDLSDNLRRAAEWAKNVRGVSAVVSAACFGMLTYVFVVLAWRYDILPTYRFIQPIARDVLATGADWLVLFTVFLTLLPTLIEFVSGALKRRSIKILEYMAYFFIFFDLVTDFTEAAALVDAWQRSGLFDPLPALLANIAVVLAKISWTFAASFAFEFLAVLFGVTGVLVFANAWSTGGGGGGR